MLRNVGNLVGDHLLSTRAPRLIDAGSEEDVSTKGEGGDGTEAQPACAADSRRSLSIEDAVRGLGVKEVYSVNQFDEEVTLEALKKAKAGRGVNVVICNSPCAVHDKRSDLNRDRVPYTIDQERCNFRI